jgi:hypothetical protein
MMQKAFLIAIAALLRFHGVDAAVDAPFIEKQFSRVDSSLAQLVALPQARMKEVEPFDDAAKQILAKHPEIASVMRTNSKGIVVNCVRRVSGESDLHADVSGREWFGVPKNTMNPYYSQLHKENKRPALIWSRPLFINTTIGGRRFGGVVAVLLDITHVRNAAGTMAAGQKQHSPALNVADTIETMRKAMVGSIAHDKQELYTDTGPEMQAVTVSPPARHAGQASMILRVAGAVAIILVGFCLWLIISTLRKQRSVLLGEEKNPSVSLDAVPDADERAADPEVDVVKSEGNAPAGFQPAYADIPAFVPAGTRESLAEHSQQPLEQSTVPFPAPSPAQETVPEEVGIEGTKIREMDEQGVYDEVAGEMRAEITDEQRNEIYKKELESMTAAIRQQLVDNEMAGLIEKLRRKLSESVRASLAEEESGRLAAEAMEDLKNEIAAKVSQQQRDSIRETVIAEITEEEHQRIDSGLRKTILENEKKRIIAEESPAFREEIRRQLRDSELDAMHSTVHDEIYSETVQTIKKNLEDKYRTVVEEKIAELKVVLQKKMKSDISTTIKADYDRLMEHIEQLSASLTNIEALQSLSQTITLLSDEKKKYKYLNLNTAQTESLLEYLKRVHNRLNIFFDKVDESVRNLMLNLGSVKNKLDDNE